MANRKVRRLTSLLVVAQLWGTSVAAADAKSLLARAKKAIAAAKRDNEPRATATQPRTSRPQPAPVATTPQRALAAPPPRSSSPSAARAAVPAPVEVAKPAAQAQASAVPEKEFEKAYGGKVVGVKTCDLRQVDWNNVVFRSARATRAYKNGKAHLEPEDDPETNNSYKLNGFDFGDVNRDGRVEAYLHVTQTEYYHGEFERTSESAELVVVDTTPSCELRLLGDFGLLFAFYGNEPGKVVRDRYVIVGETETVEFGWKDGVFDELKRIPSKKPRR